MTNKEGGSVRLGSYRQWLWVALMWVLAKEVGGVNTYMVELVRVGGLGENRWSQKGGVRKVDGQSVIVGGVEAWLS